jgi:hypothetical protein
MQRLPMDWIPSVSYHCHLWRGAYAVKHTIHVHDRHRHNDQGCFVDYYQLSDSVGVKVFAGCTTHTVHKVAQRQTEAHEAGLGPPMLGIVWVVRHKDDGTVSDEWWGYLTGHCEGVGDYSCPSGEFADIPTDISSQLMEKLRDIGHHPSDMHSLNVGEWKGKPVCIDFGYDA